MRLTDKGGWHNPIDSDMINAMYNKLAAYEDTGYSPLEIKSLEGEWNAMRAVVDSYRNAEKQGRLMRLPCKVGDTVWYIPSGTRKIYSGVCHCVSIQRGGVNIHLYDFDGDNATYSANRVFLSREAAEAALKEGRNDV